MISLFASVAQFVRIRSIYEKATIDNAIFRAHYRITTAILLASSALVSANSLIGNAISCLSDASFPNVLNTYCWISSTYTIPGLSHKHVGTHVAAPGVGQGYGQEEKYHSYYQWVPFVLFFQSILFYLPHWLWKQWENNKVRVITEGMRGALVCTKEERKNLMQRLVQYIYDSLHLHNSYAAGYFFCEALNFINVIVNIFMVDKFLGNSFLNYGLDVLKFDNAQEARADPMILVFPRVTKCTFHKYGPSGTIQKHDAMCILAINIVNEKIFIFLWFWFIILAIISGAALIYSMIIVLLPTSREYILKKRFKFNSKSGAKSLVRKTQIGDFFLLHILGQNMNVMYFNEVLDELVYQLHLGSSSSGASPTSVPSAPSTIEMAPSYPEIEKFHKDTEV